MMLKAVNVNVDYRHLQTLFRYEGSGIAYSRLQLLTQVRPDLHVTLQQGNLQHLMKAIDAGIPPAVFLFTGELPYWTEGVYHAVVLVGYTETEFYIHDPAFAHAPQVVSIGDLDLAWLEFDSYFAMVQRRSR
jgi:ABC-type bacteriocin/lantibiotic exporter with double-glycine peptidase domain